MTYEELLAKLKPTDFPFPTYSPNSVVNALVAVVKLHKPIVSEQIYNGDTGLPFVYCVVCNKRYKDTNRFVPDIALDVVYPCPTIQAIEKELQ